VSESTPYEVFAVKYAERDARRPEHFLGGDPHDVAMPMDYFVWVIRNHERTVLVDTGFGAADANRRERRLLRSAADALVLVGAEPAAVNDIILTHLHYDHAGGVGLFPDARFHVQDREMAYATGRHMAVPFFNHAFTARHVADLVLAAHDGRVAFHDGTAQIAPGIEVHHVGGHTDGLQVVRVWTPGGWIVLASDASHYYENFESTRPFPIVFDVGAMVAGYDTLRRLAGPSGIIVPGHDPAVFERHPAADPSLAGIAVRLA
jgi:glyoxylase-like metal-dependent hydrolase (beta-lactamase superfamily II)